MNYWQALLLGIVQGATEFFPVSSSAHLKLARHCLGLSEGTEWLPFDLACHAGTWLALALFLRREIWQVLKSPAQMGVFAIALLPLIPAYALLKPFRIALASPSHMGYLLLGTALLLALACQTRPLRYTQMNSKVGRCQGGARHLNQAEPAPKQLNLKSLAMQADSKAVAVRRRQRPTFEFIWVYRPRADALCIGCAQALALLPGLSRSGATMAVARFRGWSWAEGAKFSFLLSLPTILGGEIVEGFNISAISIPLCATGLLTSFIVGSLTVRFAFKLYEQQTIKPLAWYCAAVALLMIAVFRG